MGNINEFLVYNACIWCGNGHFYFPQFGLARLHFAILDDEHANEITNRSNNYFLPKWEVRNGIDKYNVIISVIQCGDNRRDERA